MDVTDRWEMAAAGLHQPSKNNQKLVGLKKRESVVSPPEGIIVINPSCIHI